MPSPPPASRSAPGWPTSVVGGGVESMSRVPMMADKPSIAFDVEVGERTGFVTIGVSADATAHARARVVPSSTRTGTSPTSGRRRPGRRASTTAASCRSPARTAWSSSPRTRPCDRRCPWRTSPPCRCSSPTTSQRTISSAAGCPSSVSSRRCTPRRPPPRSSTARPRPSSATRAAGGSGRAPRARILATATSAVRSPLLTSTVVAIRRALKLAGITPEQVDAVEVNESFSVSPSTDARASGSPRGS